MDGIRIFGIITVEESNLLKSIKSGHYPVVTGLGCLFIINISLEALMYFAGKYEQTSFFYCTFVEENGKQKVKSSYYEKQHTDQPYNKKTNPYVFIESSTDWVDASGEENYSKLGRNFKYTIPLKYFESIDRKIAENLKTFRPRSGDVINETIHCVGQHPWYLRQKLYSGLL